MKIRRADSSDVACLAAVEALQPASAGWGENGFRTELNTTAAQIWCAEQNGEIAGFVCLRLAAGFAEILNVAVHPQYCRQGIATALLRQVWQELKKQGAQEVTLEVNAQNIPAVALYQKMGLRCTGRREKFYHHTDDAFIMGKQL